MLHLARQRVAMRPRAIDRSGCLMATPGEQQVCLYNAPAFPVRRAGTAFFQEALDSR